MAHLVMVVANESQFEDIASLRQPQLTIQVQRRLITVVADSASAFKSSVMHSYFGTEMSKLDLGRWLVATAKGARRDLGSYR